MNLVRRHHKYAYTLHMKLVRQQWQTKQWLPSNNVTFISYFKITIFQKTETQQQQGECD